MSRLNLILIFLHLFHKWISLIVEDLINLKSNSKFFSLEILPIYTIFILFFFEIIFFDKGLIIPTDLVTNIFLLKFKLLIKFLCKFPGTITQSTIDKKNFLNKENILFSFSKLSQIKIFVEFTENINAIQYSILSHPHIKTFFLSLLFKILFNKSIFFIIPNLK